MTEGNFVDYVKIEISSGKGGQGYTYIVKNSLKKVVQMEEMVVVEVILLFEGVLTFGHFYI